MSHMKAIYTVFAAVLFSISVLANIDIHREEIETLMMGIFFRTRLLLKVEGLAVCGDVTN